MAGPADERISVALVRGLHGLRGAVRVEILSDSAERFAPGTVLYVEGESDPLTIAWTGPSKPGLLVRFAEVTTRETAERLRDRYLEVPESPLPEGTFYWHQIVGLEARTNAGEVLGTVQDVFRAGSAEVYVVRGGPRGEILVPAVRAVVTELAPVEGRLIIDPAAMELPPVEPPPLEPPPLELPPVEPAPVEPPPLELPPVEPAPVEPPPLEPPSVELPPVAPARVEPPRLAHADDQPPPADAEHSATESAAAEPSSSGPAAAPD